MNIPALIVAGIMSLVVLAHVFGGTRETARIAPDAADSNLTRHWVQAMCAFQMLSVDLLAVTLLLFWVAIWDLGAAEDIVLKCLIALYCLWAAVWIIQLKWLGRADAGLLKLPHWTVWIICAGILTLGV